MTINNNEWKHTVTIHPADHHIANRFLLTPEWRDKHGYIGMPSRKIFKFNNQDDQKQFIIHLDHHNVNYLVDNPWPQQN